MQPNITAYRFGQFTLRPRDRRLLAQDFDVQLPTRAFDLLLALVENDGHLATREELSTLIWPRVVVEENSLHALVSTLRKALGKHAIATVPGQGYRFNMPVTCDASQMVGAAKAAALNNLPEALTSFVGRETEIAELGQLMQRARLVTVTGAGGCGKTRLALQFAATARANFPDGVWLLELASLSNPATLEKTLADVLGLKESTTSELLQVITDYLGAQSTLLIFDNAEHLTEACARLADQLLKRCAATSILVTSRETLSLIGESTFRVPSLSVPSTGVTPIPDQLLSFESVRLFIARARLHDLHFDLTQHNAASLASICRRLDGVPLAIELAAARSRTMSPEEIDRHLDQRFSLLTDGSRVGSPRHRTLRALIDWSYELLDDDEKALFYRVSVFSDGWTIDAAQQVCSIEAADRSIPELLNSLANKSLIVSEPQTRNVRFRLLETLRQYGQERLQQAGEEQLRRERHLDWLVALAEEGLPHFTGPGQTQWLDQLELEHDNLRAALDWAGTRDSVAKRLRLAGAVWRFWWLRGYLQEGRAAFDKLLASPAPPADTAIRARALMGAGQMALMQGDRIAAKSFQEGCLALYQSLGDQAGIASSLDSLGGTIHEQGDFVGGHQLRQDALAMFRSLGEQRQIAGCLSNLGYMARDRGELADAQSLLEESLAIRRELDDTWGIAAALLNLSGVARDRGDVVSGQPLAEESLTIYRSLGDRRGAAYALGTLSGIACDTADWPVANATMKEGLSILFELGDQSGTVLALDRLAIVHAESQPACSARIWGAVASLRQEMGFPRGPHAQAEHDMCVVSARNACNDGTEFDHAWRTGIAMDLQHISAYALTL